MLASFGRNCDGRVLAKSFPWNPSSSISRLFLIAIPLGISIGATSLSFSSAIAQEKKDAVVDDNPGLASLDEATDLKLGADTPDKLSKVIEKAEEALKKGLDAENTKLAKELIAGTAYQKAQSTYEQFVKSRVRNPNAMRRLRNGMLVDVNKAIANAPDFMDAYLLLAQIEEAPKALEAATKAIELCGNDASKKAKAYMIRAAIQSDPKEKIADFEKARDADPSNLEVRQAVILLMSSEGDYEAVLKDSQALLKQQPENLFAIRAAAESLTQLGRNTEAIALLKEKIEADIEAAQLYPTLAKLIIDTPDLEKNDYEDAVKYLDKTIEADPRNVQALLMRCQAHLQLEKVEDAEKDVEDVLSVQPNNPGGLYFRSLIAVQQKRFADAIEDLKKVVAMAPDNAAFLLQLGSFYQLDDRPRKAIQIADEIIESKNEEWKSSLHKALRLRGDAHLSIGDHKLAMEDFEKAIKALDGTKDKVELREKSGLLNNLAWVLATSPNDDMRDGARAVKLGTEACEITEFKEAHILSTLAAAYAEIGNFEEAVKWSQKSVDRGREEKTEQLEQLEKELESYKAKKPWREKQDTKDKKGPIAPSSEGVDA